MAAIALWIWRVLNTALLAAAVWILWQHAIELKTLNGELVNLVNYLSEIAERQN